MKNLIDVGPGKILNSWKLIQEVLEIGNYCSDLGLLQHDFRNPDSIGCGVLLPWQIVSARFVEPAKNIFGERAHGFAWESLAVKQVA